MKKKRPKIGLAIGGGAAYGLSAIGVLKVFEEEKIPIDVISGTSIGAVIGALYASGMKTVRLEDEMLTTQWKELIDFVFPRRGVISGKKVETYIRQLVNNKTFKELNIPLYVVAADLNTGQRVVFHKGDVAAAVRASISIPGIFTPVVMGDMELVDGGVVDPVPADVLQKRADKIIAIEFSKELGEREAVSVKPKQSELLRTIRTKFIETELRNITHYLKRRHIKIPVPFRWFLSPKYLTNMIRKKEFQFSPPDILEITKRSHAIMENELIRLKLQIAKTDLIIKPDLKKMNWLEFDKGEYAVKQGEIAAKEKLKKIKKVVGIRKR